jgi:hypothetical protein
MADVPLGGRERSVWPSSGPGSIAAHPRRRGFWPGEWQLDLDQLLAGLGDIVTSLAHSWRPGPQVW